MELRVMNAKCTNWAILKSDSKVFVEDCWGHHELRIDSNVIMQGSCEECATELKSISKWASTAEGKNAMCDGTIIGIQTYYTGEDNGI